jgi:hypothetical protein
MPGASTQTRQIKVLNANWAAGAAGEDGQFEIMIVAGSLPSSVLWPSLICAAGYKRLGLALARWWRPRAVRGSVTAKLARLRG